MDSRGRILGEPEQFKSKTYPDIKSLAFTCLEADTLQSRMVEWKDRFEPQLIEYIGTWKSKGAERMIFGSWLK